ncbi:MAG: hypothetical protein IJX38_00220 [Clostridia bacterium]|nr:hypothetical protein [Clostridia bacterium]
MIDKLIGCKLDGASRILNLASLEFKSKESESIHLHIQCFFRIVSGSTVLVSSDDMYECRSNVDPDDFEWDAPGQSLYDECILEKHKEILFSSAIISAEKNSIGDLVIRFENCLELQAFVNSTTEDCEMYRIFDEKEHFVVEVGSTRTEENV